MLTSQGAGALPQWANATGTGTVNSGAINDLAYYAAAGNTVSGLTTANGGVLVTSNTGVPSILAGSGTTANILQTVSGGTPAWSNATYPTSTTISQILYSSATNVVSGLATANSGVLVTSGTGVPSILAAGTTGQVLQASTAGTPAWSTATYPATAGTSGNFLASNGTNFVSTTLLGIANGGTGLAASDPVVQRVSTLNITSTTGTTTIPFDDTIPQNTEGDQYMTQAITPKNTANILVIEALLTFGSSTAANYNLTMALFQDTTANALACQYATYGITGGAIEVYLTYIMTAGTTSSTTFKIRAGAQGAGTTTTNGQGGNRKYGGVLTSYISITEYTT